MTTANEPSEKSSEFVRGYEYGYRQGAANALESLRKALGIDEAIAKAIERHEESYHD